MKMMNQKSAAQLLAGIGLGAAVMYFLDPARGKARRNVTTDRAGSMLRGTNWNMRKTGIDLRNRARGVAAQMRQQFSSETPTDNQLVERVRAELGHHADSLSQLDVTATNGTVTVRGHARGIDPDDVISFVERVRGVEQVEDQLDRNMS